MRQFGVETTYPVTIDIREREFPCYNSEGETSKKVPVYRALTITLDDTTYATPVATMGFDGDVLRIFIKNQDDDPQEKKSWRESTILAHAGTRESHYESPKEELLRQFVEKHYRDIKDLGPAKRDDKREVLTNIFIEMKHTERINILQSQLQNISPSCKNECIRLFEHDIDMSEPIFNAIFYKKPNILEKAIESETYYLPYIIDYRKEFLKSIPQSIPEELDGEDGKLIMTIYATGQVRCERIKRINEELQDGTTNATKIVKNLSRNEFLIGKGKENMKVSLITR